MKQDDKQSVGQVQTQSLRVVQEGETFELASGQSLAPIDVAYETYGQLTEAGDNAVLICHALTGNAHVAGFHDSEDRKPGWWDDMVGPGKGIDTDRYFVICSNFLGGCGGTTGPSSVNPATGQPYGLDFPVTTIADMVKVQKLLLDKLGIKQLLAVIGGSVGGMQVLQWMIDYPDFMRAAIPIATTFHLNAQSIAFDAVGRNAILADEKFRNGQYHQQGGPDRGLAIARMIAHITYLSEEGMRTKFGRQLRHAQDYSYDFDSEFSVETYLDHQGQSFVERFDANSYLYITKASDYFDLIKSYGSLQQAFAGVQSRTLVISFSSDWLFTPGQSRAMVDALVAQDKDVSYCNIESSYGHDAFLLEHETLGRFISCFLEATCRSPEQLQESDCCGQNNRRALSIRDMAQRSRVDYALIDSLIEPGSTILDIGCGDGELLNRLRLDKDVDAKGIELQQDLVLGCVCRRLSIIQQDIEQQLNYGDKSFDYVILSQTVQTLTRPKKVLEEMLRIGKKVIVSFPNFAHWNCRWQLIGQGHAPVTKQLPFGWYNSPNIHFFSIKDFDEFCRKLRVQVEHRIPLTKHRQSPVRWAPNLLAEQAIYVISRE